MRCQFIFFPSIFFRLVPYSKDDGNWGYAPKMERDGRLVDAGKVKIIRPIPISECEEWKRMDKEKERKPFKWIRRKGEGIHNRSEIVKKINISHIPCVTHARCLTSCQKHGPKNIFHHVLLPFFLPKTFLTSLLFSFADPTVSYQHATTVQLRSSIQFSSKNRGN